MAWLKEYDRDEITQGTIVDNVPWEMEEAPLGIVLTNACDVEWNKASYLLIASLLPAKDILQNSTEFEQITQSADEENKLSKTKSNSLGSFLRDFIHNTNIVRYFFIDPTPVYPSLPHFFVDFQHLITIPYSEKINLSTIAQLDSPHREKLILHFSSYVSRIAVDRIDKETYQDTLRALSEPFELKF
ncbi:MAG: hypothetical protein JJU13_08315 [Balneolaceae bacterium]|nr:hypothetical protein [Balneolaceae bacterium]